MSAKRTETDNLAGHVADEQDLVGGRGESGGLLRERHRGPGSGAGTPETGLHRRPRAGQLRILDSGRLGGHPRVRHEEKHLRQHRGPAGARQDGDSEGRFAEELPRAETQLRPGLRSSDSRLRGLAGRHYGGRVQDQTDPEVSQVRLGCVSELRIGRQGDERSSQAKVRPNYHPSNSEQINAVNF